MTNYEYLMSSKEALAKFLNSDRYIWQIISDWWCGCKCPHRENGYCKYDECKDTHSDNEITMIWFEEEYDEGKMV